MSLLRVLIADDHPLIRLAIRGALAALPETELCGEATNGREAIEQRRALSPDVVIMDIQMPEMNGLDATRTIRLDMPGVEILMFTMDKSEQTTKAAQQAGARGCLLKTDPPCELFAALLCSV